MDLIHTLEMRCQKSRRYPRIIPQMSHRPVVKLSEAREPIFKGLTDSQVCAPLHHFLTLCYASDAVHLKKVILTGAWVERGWRDRQDFGKETRHVREGGRHDPGSWVL